MKVNINIDVESIYNNRKINKKDIIKTAKAILEYFLNDSKIYPASCLCAYGYNKISFDILFCDGEKTHEINRDYRDKDYPADIITFAVFADSPEDERFVLDLEINLGEVIIAVDKIEQQAQEKGIDSDTELKFFISHGIMHLLGFDHQTQEDFEFVVNNQKSALSSIGIKYDKI